MTTPQQFPEIPEDFRDELNDIYHAWHDGTMTFSEALKQLETVRGTVGDDEMKQAALDNILGIIYGYRSSFDMSIKYFTSARQHFEKAGALPRVVTCDLNLGESYRLRGNFTKARSYFHYAYEGAKQYGSIRAQTTALTNEGQLWMSMNSPDKARSVLEQALELSVTPWTAIDERPDADVVRADNTCEIHHALAEICLIEGNPEQAWQHALQSRYYAEQIDRPIRIGYANRALGIVITDLFPVSDTENDPDTYFKTATKAFRKVKAEGEIAKTMYAHAMSLAKRGNKRRAGQLLQQAMITFTKLGMTNDAAKAAQAQLDVL